LIIIIVVVVAILVPLALLLLLLLPSVVAVTLVFNEDKGEDEEKRGLIEERLREKSRGLDIMPQIPSSSLRQLPTLLVSFPIIL